VADATSTSKSTGLAEWLETRFELDAVRHFLAKKRVPQHRHTIWYYLGGMTLFLFMVQVVTGILLLLYYRPSAAEAYESVQFIVTRVEFGWLVRNVHSWSANLLIAVAVAHMVSVLFLRAYRRPRELTWVTGAGLLFLMLGFGFSGYLLPWNELAFFATKVGTGIPGALPVIGDGLVRLLRGGDEVTGATLSRFYGLHVAILPALTTALLAVHLMFVQVQGMSVPPDVERRQRNGERIRQMPFFPHFVLRDVVGWYVALAMLAALAAFSPWELGVKADPFAPVPPGIRPEWYFLAAFQILKLLPSHVLGVEGELAGVLGFGALAAGFVLLPFLDRGAADGRPSRILTWGALVVLAALAVMTVVGYVLA
jgi:cytochrome b6